MPIYEYKGQQYDIATDDASAAKTKILTYLGSQEQPAPKPVAKDTQVTESSNVDFGSPMGTGFEETVAATEDKPRKTYTGSVFDTQPFNPSSSFNSAEAERLSNRAYAEQSMLPPRRQPSYLMPTPQDEIERSALREATDTYLGVVQGVISIPKGIVDNILGDNPLSQFFENLYQGAEKSKSGYLRSKNLQHTAYIENVRKNQGELASTRAAFNSMFSASGADIIAKGAGSVIPAIGMSVLGLGAKSMMAMNALANAGDAAQQTAAKLAEMSPEEWSNSNAYQSLREQGLNHRDAVRLLAPMFALPAQAVGLITGAASGATGLEKTLVKGGANTVRGRFGRAGAEFAGEQLETLAPQATGNITQRLLDDKTALLDGLGQAAVETLFATGPGAGLASLKGEAKTEQKRKPVSVAETPSVPPAPLTPAPTPVSTERIEPTFNEAAFTQAAPAVETPPTTPAPAPATPAKGVTPEQLRSDRIEQLTTVLEQQGIPSENAGGIATRRVDAQLKAEAKTAAIKLPENRVEAVTQDLIAAGVSPQQAKIDAQKLVQEEVDADANAAAGAETTVPTQQETTGAENATGPIEQPSGTSTGVDTRANTEQTTAGTIGAQPSGVVFTGTDVGSNLDGTSQQPPALETPTETPTETKGAELGTETTEAVQATQEEQEAADTVTPAKRGPKPATTEVKEQKKLSRDEQTRVNNSADYNLKKLVAQLNAVLTPEQIKELTFEEAKQADIDAKQSRNNALRGLLELQGSPNIARGSAVGKRISAAIKNSKATEAELTRVRQGMKRAQEVLTGPKDNVLGPTVLLSTTSNVDKADAGFNSLTTGAQAITQVIKTGNIFQRFVAGRIRNFLNGVKFVVVEKGDGTPVSISKDLASARGLFINDRANKERTVYVRGASYGDGQGINNITVLHELLHAATANRISAGLLSGFRNAQLQKFIREMQGLMQRSQEAYEEGLKLGEISDEMQVLVENTISRNKLSGIFTASIFADPNEFLAYGMSSPEFQKFLMGVKGTRTEGTGFSKFVSSVRDLFGLQKSDATAFSDLVDITDKMLGTRVRSTGVDTSKSVFKQAQGDNNQTPAELFDEQADAKAKRSALQIAKDSRIAKEKVRLSREGELSKNVEFMQLMRDPKAVREIFVNAVSGMSYAKLQAAVRLPTFDFLAKWAADAGIPSLNQANTQLQRMLGMSQQFLVGAEQVIGSLKRGFKEDPKLDPKKFADFVYATTLAEIDPSDPNARERDKERLVKNKKAKESDLSKITSLDTDYKALGPVGQRMYKQLRDYYEAVIDLYSDILDEQIANIQGMAPEAKANLMVLVRKTFETTARIKPFFPLVRRGDFFLAIGSGKNRLFYLFESRADRNAKAKELAEGRGEDYEDVLFRQEFVQGNDLKELRAASQNSSEMLKKLFEAIDAENLGSPEARAGLKDAAYQIYLTTMPEQSFRRQFIHRKGIAGFSTDLLRNIATTASKQSIQLARLKYAPLLRSSLAGARESIREREELSPFVQEAEKRVDMALSGAHGSLSEAVAGFANKSSYFWFLSGVSSALIQPSSIFISGLPVLAGNYNDAPGAALEIGKMTLLVNQYSVFRSNADGTTSITAPSIANNKSLPADERKAISQMVSRGVSESTYASLVWGYKSMSTEQFEGVTGKGKRLANLLVGALMHNTERLSREAVYLAAYRLGKKQGLDFETAVQKAVDSTNESLGNYDITNRPRFMQQGIGKVAFQFKTYPLQMTLLMLTNFKKMFPFLNKEGKKEAATKFFGMIGSSFLLAGASNTALFSPVMGLIGWAWSKMRDDEDWPEELKDLDFETWFRTVFLPEKLGNISIGGVPVSDIVDRGALNAITGYDIASRIGLNDLWGRDSKETKTSRESAIAFMLDHFAGPTASLGLGFADAYDAYALGDYQKMREKLAPAALRNLLVASKYADEGMKTGRGSELVGKDDVKTGELIGQAIGFRPDILAATQGPSFKLQGVEQKINNQRNLILNRLGFQHRQETDKGDEKFEKIIEVEVSKFNAKYPSYAITSDTIIDSILKKAEQRSSARAGINITEKNAAILDEPVTNLEQRLEKREAEMKARREKNPR